MFVFWSAKADTFNGFNIGDSVLDEISVSRKGIVMAFEPCPSPMLLLINEHPLQVDKKENKEISPQHLAGSTGKSQDFEPDILTITSPGRNRWKQMGTGEKTNLSWCGDAKPSSVLLFSLIIIKHVDMAG